MKCLIRSPSLPQAKTWTLIGFLMLSFTAFVSTNLNKLFIAESIDSTTPIIDLKRELKIYKIIDFIKITFY